MQENIDKIKEAARIYAGLPKNFDSAEESYYQPEKIKIYEAFLAGVIYCQSNTLNLSIQ